MYLRIFSVLAAAAGTILLLIALATDYWMVITFDKIGPTHNGLWKFCIWKEKESQCIPIDVVGDFVVAARTFMIMAFLLAVALQVFLIATCFPSMPGILKKPILATAASSVAGLFTLIAVAVYTGETRKRIPPQQIAQVTFAWSIYLGWAASPLLLLAGILNHFAFLNSPPYHDTV